MSRAAGKLRIGLTDAGKMILRGIGFVALAAVIIPAFGVLSALVSVMLTAFLVGIVLRPRIQIRGNFPDRIIVNQAVQLSYSLTNIGRFPVYNLRLIFEALPEAIEQLGHGKIISCLGSGETVELTVSIKAKRRGYYTLNKPACRSSFPFRLFSFGISNSEKESLVVLPFFSLLRFRFGSLNPQTLSGSSILAGRTGSFPEYAGNRPFLPGDSRRRIDARAWARLAMPATKEYHENYDNRTAIILDTGIPKASMSTKSVLNEDFEAAVSLCASLVYTVNNHCLVDMMIVGSKVHHFTNLPRKIRVDKIHEILAGVEPSEEGISKQMVSAMADRLSLMSEVLYVLLDFKKSYQQLLEFTGNSGCHNTVFVVGRAGRNSIDKHEISWDGNFHVISPEQILQEQVNCL